MKKILKYIGSLAMFIFGMVFIFRWVINEELLLDQVLGFVIGLIIFSSSFFIGKRKLI